MGSDDIHEYLMAETFHSAGNVYPILKHLHVRLLEVEGRLVTHPDGKRFYRNSADMWLPLE